MFQRDNIPLKVGAEIWNIRLEHSSVAGGVCSTEMFQISGTGGCESEAIPNCGVNSAVSPNERSTTSDCPNELLALQDVDGFLNRAAGETRLGVQRCERRYGLATLVRPVCDPLAQQAGQLDVRRLVAERINAHADRLACRPYAVVATSA
jgi:hypothetical protein